MPDTLAPLNSSGTFVVCVCVCVPVQKCFLIVYFLRFLRKKNTFIFKTTKYVVDDVSPGDNVSMSSYIIIAHHLC